jgi:DNA-binding NarL/FixJ family response regulator
MSVRVLVVDDHDVFRRAARAVVWQSPGFELVGEATSGEESIDQTRRLQPDLVLMDVRLPGIDGVEAARRIARLERHPVVVLISTSRPDELGVHLASSGAAGFIAKEQFGPASLAAAWAAADGRLQ